MNSNYNIPSQYNGINQGYVESLRSFKGNTEIVYNFDEVSSGGWPIIKIIIDFNDDTPLLIKDFSFKNKDKIQEIVRHRYIPSKEYQNIVYYPTMYITFANFSTFVYQTPIKIGRESFYSAYKRLNVASCQFLDNSEHSTFLTLDTSKGDILNLKIK
jgi:hypothetical protein